MKIIELHSLHNLKRWKEIFRTVTELKVNISEQSSSLFTSNINMPCSGNIRALSPPVQRLFKFLHTVAFNRYAYC